MVTGIWLRDGDGDEAALVAVVAAHRTAKTRDAHFVCFSILRLDPVVPNVRGGAGGLGQQLETI